MLHRAADASRRNPAPPAATAAPAGAPGRHGAFPRARPAPPAPPGPPAFLAPLVLLALLAPLVSLALLAAPAAADSAVLDAAALPHGRDGMGLAWTGSRAYVYGGHGPGHALRGDVLAFDPAAGTFTTLAEGLGTNRSWASAVWTGTEGYVFGGFIDWDGLQVPPATDEVLRHDPAAGTVQVVAELPTARDRTSAVWTGTLAYVFGGRQDSLALADILAFDPATHEVTLQAAVLPGPRGGTSAVWDPRDLPGIGCDDGCAYVFGGSTAGEGVVGPEVLFDDIVRFHPKSGTVEVMEAKLPSVRDHTSAVFDGAYAYVFGGYAQAAHRREVVRYDPVEDAVLVMAAQLPNGGNETAALWDGSRAFVLGGHDPAGPLDDVVRYTLEPGPVQALAAAGGVGLVNVTWAAPAANTHGGPVTGYDVRAGPDASSLSLAAELGPGARHWLETGLGDDVPRSYQVHARTAAGPGPWTGPASATTFDFPSAPQALEVVRGNNLGQLRLSWSAPADTGNTNLTGYRVYRGNASGEAALVAEVGPGVLQLDDWDLGNNVTRWYRASAVNARGEGPMGAEDHATTIAPPSPPRALTVTWQETQERFHLEWDFPADHGGSGVNKFRVYRAAPGAAEVLLAEIPVICCGNDWHFDSGVPFGAQRTYRVTAANVAGEGPPSDAVVGTSEPNLTPLAAQKGPGAGEVTLTWTAPADEDPSLVAGYKVQRGASGSCFLATTVVTVPASARAYTWTGMGNAESHCYLVQAFHAGAAGDFQQVVLATFDVPFPPPGRSAGAGPGRGDITVSWGAASTEPGAPVLAYHVYRDEAGVPKLLATLDAGARSHRDAGLADGATHAYRVAAVNLAGASSLGISPSVATTFSLPGAVRSLAAQAGPGLGGIRLTWQAPLDTGGAPLTYELAAGPSLDTLELLGSTTAMTFDHTGLGEGVARTYLVRARNVVGPGPDGDPASATTWARPGEPRQPATASGPGAGQVTLTWLAPASDGGRPVASYAIHRGLPGGALAPHAVVPGNATSFVDAGLPEGAVRAYRVLASNLVGEGPASAAVEGRAPTRPGPPQALAAMSTALPGRVNLAWDAPLDTGGVPITGYRVLRGTSPQALQQVAELGNVTSWQDGDASLTHVVHYAVRAMNVVGAGPQGPGACTSAWPPPLAAPLGEGCPLRAGWEEHTLLEATLPVGAPGAGAGLVVVDGAPRAGNPSVYELRVRVAGQPLPVVGVFTGGLVGQPVHLELLPPDSGDLALRLTARHDPADRTCLLSLGPACVGSVPGQPLARDAELAVHVSGAGLGAQVVRVPAAGAWAGGLPGLPGP